MGTRMGTKHIWGCDPLPVAVVKKRVYRYLGIPKWTHVIILVVTVGRAHPKTSSQHNLENQFSSEPTVHRRIPGIFIPSEGRVNEKTGCVEEKLTDGMKGLSTRTIRIFPNILNKKCSFLPNKFITFQNYIFLHLGFCFSLKNRSFRLYWHLCWLKLKVVRFIPEMGRTETLPRSQRGTWWRTVWGGEEKVGKKKQMVHKVNHGLMVIYQVFFHFLPW